MSPGRSRGATIVPGEYYPIICLTGIAMEAGKIRPRRAGARFGLRGRGLRDGWARDADGKRVSGKKSGHPGIRWPSLLRLANLRTCSVAKSSGDLPHCNLLP